MDCNPPGSSVHGIFQVRILEWVAIAFSNTIVQKHQFFSAQLSFMVQLSYPYTTTRKTITLTRWTFVVKVMSQLFNMLSGFIMASLVAQRVKNLPAVQETQFRSLGWEDPQRRKWQPTPVFLPGKSHGWRSLAGYSPWNCKELDMTEWLHFLSFMGCIELNLLIYHWEITSCEICKHASQALPETSTEMPKEMTMF